MQTCSSVHIQYQNDNLLQNHLKIRGESVVLLNSELEEPECVQSSTNKDKRPLQTLLTPYLKCLHISYLL